MLFEAIKEMFDITEMQKAINVVHISQDDGDASHTVVMVSGAIAERVS